MLPLAFPIVTRRRDEGDQQQCLRKQHCLRMMNNNVYENHFASKIIEMTNDYSQ